MYVLNVFLLIILFLTTLARKEKPTPGLVTVETTTQTELIITDIPESDVKAALNLDYGTYTTMVFNYINSQFDHRMDVDKCVDDLIKCQITQGMATPVCVMNDPYDKYYGFRTFNSYCDVYYDNCRRGMRFWHIITHGRCVIHGRVYDIHIPHTYRKKNLNENVNEN